MRMKIGENMSDFFKFEEANTDFPFYNNKPKLSIIDWIVLLAGIILFIGLLEYIDLPNENYYPIAYFLATFLPLAFISRGKLGIYFKKLRKSDISVIVKCLIGYYLYAIIMVSLISFSGTPTASNAALESSMDIIFWINVFIQIMGEELFKLSLFLLLMFIIYKLAKNRKMSIVLSVLITLLVFGLMHHTAYADSWLQIIFVIGLGSVFYLYAYLKTKNILTSYIVHLLIDLIVFTLGALAPAMI